MPLTNLLKYTKGGLKSLGMIIQNPKNLYFITHQAEVFEKQAIKKYPQFANGLPQLLLTDLMDEDSVSISTYSFLGGTSEPTDIALLKVLASTFDECHYFEIGTWRGESIINLEGNTVSRCSLNLPLSELEKRVSNNVLAAHNFYLSKQPGLELLEGDSTTFDFSKLPSKDLIFIDGDHHNEVVSSDTKSVFQHLVKENSIVVWHDYTSHFSSIWWEVFLGILDGCPEQYHNKLYHIRNTNCAVYIPWRVEASSVYNQWVPQESFEVTIKKLNP